MTTRFFVEGLEIDLNEDFPIDLNFSVADVTDFGKRNTSFSKTIRIPGSSRNKKIFGHIYEIGSANSYDPNIPNVNVNFNPTKRAAGLVYQNNTIIFDGVVRLISIEQRFNDIEFEINLFGRAKDLFFELKEKKITELNLDSLRTPFTAERILDFFNFKEKWNTDAEIAALQTSTGKFLPNICFPFVDYGYSATMTDFPMKNFKMAIFVRELWDQIHKQNGFEYDAPFVDTEFFKQLILVKGDDALTTTKTPFKNNKQNFVSGFLTDQPGFNGWGVSNNILFSPIYNYVFEDQGGGFFKYIVNQEYNGKIKLSYDSYIINSIQGFAGTSIQCFKQTGSNPPVLLGAIPFVGFTPSSQVFPATIKKDDIVYTRVLFYGDSEPANPFLGLPALLSSMDVILNGVQVELFTDNLAEYDLLEGADIDVALSLPKGIKQREFIQLVIQYFNLYVVEDKFQKNKLRYIPYPFFYDLQTENAVDWTNKIDRSKPTKIVPIGELVAREFKVTYSSDSDFYSENYRKTWEKEYGESSFINDNEFELSDKTIKVITGTPLMRREVGERICIPMYKVESGVKKPGTFKPRIAMYKRNRTCSTWTITPQPQFLPPGSIFGFIPLNSYPYAGHLNDPENPTQDILFGRPEVIYFTLGAFLNYPNTQIGAAFFNDLFERYSDKDSKIVTAFFKLDAIDIETLDFARLIRVGNNYFILSKVEEYTPNGESLAKVTLIKVSRNLAIQDLFFILQEDGDFLLQENNSSRFYI